MQNGWMPSCWRRIGKVSRSGFLIDGIWVVQEREGLTRVIPGMIIRAAVRFN